MSVRHGPTARSRSPLPTPARVSPRRISTGFSRSFSRPTSAPTRRRGPGSGWRCRSASSRCTAEESGATACSARAARSGSPCRWGRPSNDGRAGPRRRGQSAQHEAVSRCSSWFGLPHSGGVHRRRGGRARHRAPSQSRAHGYPASRHRRHRGAQPAARGRAALIHADPCPDRTGDGGRPRALPRRRLRRLPLQAGGHRRIRRHREALLRRWQSMSDDRARILVVDDVPENVRLLEAVLDAQGYDIVTATDGQAALDLALSAQPDLVLLDVMMPPPDGLAVCRQLRQQEETAVLPVIMLTASEGSEKTTAIEAGADDFLPKPFDRDELLIRVRSLLRIKRYHDTIKAQAAELLELNGTLEERVREQVTELERLRKLRRFLSPQLSEAIVSSGDDSILKSHRRKVTMFFADLRGWTSFVDGVEPEEPMQVLGEFHATVGDLVREFDVTVGFLEGDGVQLFFNDPTEVPDAALRAVRLGCALRERMRELTAEWRKRGYELGCGAGIALGYATCGEVGFEARSDYAAIGTVTNLASRLADEATAGQILVAQRLYAEVEDDVDAQSVGEFRLKGFQRPVPAFDVVGIREHAATQSSLQASYADQDHRRRVTGTSA